MTLRSQERVDLQELHRWCSRPIPSYVSEVAEKVPAGHLAVVASHGSLTYRELERMANRLANGIKDRIGLGRQSVVLMMERSDLAIVGILAVLKAGKVCVPVHPVNNEARVLDSVVRDLDPPLVLTDRKSASVAGQLATNAKVVDVEATDFSAFPEDDPQLASPSDDLAFIIYNLGSTGTPKGVMHSHRNILSRLFWYAKRFSIDDSDRSLMLSSPDHVSGVMGMLRPLITGGQAHLFKIRHEGFNSLERRLNEDRITIVPMVNSVFRSFADDLTDGMQFPTVRLIILGGEAMTMEDVVRYRRHFDENCLLLNTFGCTELPTYRHFVINKRMELSGGSIPLGHAVPGIDVSIVDSNGRSLETGQIGEIVAHSPYLSLGYWNRPEETRERFFVDDNDIPAYRTGDNGRLRDDGTLEFVGRKDWQVKIMGNRVELGEIESTLCSHPSIRAAAVKVLDGPAGRIQLCAYVVQDTRLLCTDHELKAFLRGQLPDYMVPMQIVNLSSLPLTRSGKVDRGALPDPGGVGSGDDRGVNISPRSDLERRIAVVCQAVLHVDAIGINENLFDLGADSLVVLKLVNELNAALKLKMSMTAPFEYPTIADLASYVTSTAVA